MNIICSLSLYVGSVVISNTFELHKNLVYLLLIIYCRESEKKIKSKGKTVRCV